MTSRQQTLTDLKAARYVLLECGWKQKSFGSLRGGVCALGAVSSAILGKPTPDLPGISPQLRDRLLNAIVALVPVTEGKVLWKWNDEDGRTADQVLEAFDAAILASERLVPVIALV